MAKGDQFTILWTMSKDKITEFAMRIYQHSLCQDIVLNLNIVSTYVTIPNALCHVTIFIAIYVKRCLIPNIYILLYFSIKFCDLYMPLNVTSNHWVLKG